MRSVRLWQLLHWYSYNGTAIFRETYNQLILLGRYGAGQCELEQSFEFFPVEAPRFSLLKTLASS
jgi:hypothetical protein